MTFRIFLLFATLLSAFPSVADTLEGRVVAVSDGDTIQLLDSSNKQWKIRLMGIDAPEKKQAFGQKSKQHLSDLIYDQLVTVEYSKNDRYGRAIGKILVNGTDVNFEQIKAGLAWHYKKYQKEQSPSDRSQYADAESTARAGHLGLWADADPTPPWEFRHRR